MENNIKKLERSRRNRVIAGVCAGLADYFNIDVALVRVLFVVATICGGCGFWLYVILWIVVPEELILEQGSSNIDDTIDITPKEEEVKKKTGNGAMIAGLILVFIGLVALIDNFTSLAWIWKLWPVVLILIGAMILIKTQKNEKNGQ